MPTETEPRGIDVAAVTAWIADHVADVEPPLTFDLIAAGGSNLTFRVTDTAGRRFALRRPPVGHGLPTAHDMGREYRIMSALADSDVPVPACHAFCDDHSVNDADFYLMGFADGAIWRSRDDTESVTKEEADVATRSLVDVQVAFHTIDLEAVGLDTLGRHTDYVARQLKRWRGQVERAGVREVPLMVELHERLSAAIPPEREPAGLAHGDYRFDNTVLGDDHRIIAVLDWELCTTGNPVADFVWSLQYWADPGDELTFLVDPPTTPDQFIRRSEVADLYASTSGFDLSDLPYYTTFSWWKQACIREGAMARRMAGATGGMRSDHTPEEMMASNDAMFEHAHELARGVI